MPVNYKLYPKDWKKVIRPAILERANNRCEQCSAKNGEIVCRGEWNGKKVYQDEDGAIFDALTGESYGSSYCGDVWHDKKQVLTKIVLTISHFDHDITNNDYSNLNALCQMCHLAHDKRFHSENAKQTRLSKKGQLKIF